MKEKDTSRTVKATIRIKNCPVELQKGLGLGVIAIHDITIGGNEDSGFSKDTSRALATIGIKNTMIKQYIEVIVEEI